MRNIAVHKGLAFGPRGYEYSTARDVGPAAVRYPDMVFLIYHSGFDTSVKEGPYDPQAKAGVDVLVRSMREAGRPKNVYAELGSTWRFVMRDPDQAAHLLGKLLVTFGEDNILWGTDSIWYGSPQDQIQAFRAFEISREFQEKYRLPGADARDQAQDLRPECDRVYGLMRPCCDDGSRATASKGEGRIPQRSAAQLCDLRPAHASRIPGAERAAR